MATKPSRVVTYNEQVHSVKSYDFLITWSSDFDFSYTICRFKTQRPKSSPTSCCICLQSKVLWNCQCFFCRTFVEYRGIRGKKIFYRPSTSYYNSVIYCYKKNFLWFVLFLNMSQRREIP